MLNDLPAELLLNILSFLDNTEGLSSSSRNLNSAVGDYQASVLRGRLARIPQADRLVQIWSPSFFSRDGRGRRSPTFVSRPLDLLNILGDPTVVPLVERYIDTLERKAQVAQEVANYLVTIVNFSGFRSNEARMSFATTLVIYLWSVEQRHGHDIDGYLSTLRDGYTFQDLCARDQFFLDLPADTRRYLAACYSELSKYLRHPFGPQGEGMWLQRVIAQRRRGWKEFWPD
ncbi:hypothetical protein K440DRAFT_638222 [Wilcoxina mikolae CBS 423.85]|nr:hypothetical protein K440DRAFT_638222 [Wilcoxina mikolae CBS 423.85]